VAYVDQLGKAQQVLAGIQEGQLAAVAGRELVYGDAWLSCSSQ
jgi:hypothetical protein